MGNFNSLNGKEVEELVQKTHCCSIYGISTKKTLNFQSFQQSNQENVPKIQET